MASLRHRPRGHVSSLQRAYDGHRSRGGAQPFCLLEGSGLVRAATGVSWRLAAALCAASCGQPPGSAAPRDDAAVGAKVVDDGPVWITTGRDSLDLVRRVL